MLRSLPQLATARERLPPPEVNRVWALRNAMRNVLAKLARDKMLAKIVAKTRMCETCSRMQTGVSVADAIETGVSVADNNRRICRKGNRNIWNRTEPNRSLVTESLRFVTESLTCLASRVALSFRCT